MYRSWWSTKRGWETASLRMQALEGVALLELSESAVLLAEELVAKGPLPEKAAIDASHVAVAVNAGIDYLLTWNFKHLANAAMRTKIESICRLRGYRPCTICTPDELLEE